MKFALTLLFLFASSTVFADGFRCESEHFKVKVYNQTNPHNGTKNPTALVVYEKGVGTIASLHGDKISKEIRENFVSYEGLDNHDINGRFVYVVLSIAKRAQAELNGLHLGKLSLSRDNKVSNEKLYCERYIKGARR